MNINYCKYLYIEENIGKNMSKISNNHTWLSHSVLQEKHPSRMKNICEQRTEVESENA